MNFVGHAHLALDHDDAPAFVLGSMLPDFASMSRARLSMPADPTLAAGVALHYRTDDAFHTAPPFVELCVRWGPELEARGLSWGAARACAHVGTELLLDGLLLDDPRTRNGYLAAVAALDEPSVRDVVLASTHATPERAARWRDVLERVRHHGVPDFYRDPIVVADRLVQILAGRPRLSIAEEQRGPLREAMQALRAEVVTEADALLRATRDALARDDSRP